MKSTNTSLIVLGLGTAVTLLGTTLMKNSRYGTGVTGFGLAHIVLGALDLLRPSVRNDS